MSPEQATGQETDHRVDMYALGCILYEMLTGDVPFKGENAPKTLTKHVFDAVLPPSQKRPDLDIPPVLEAIVLCMLEKKPGDRYGDMRQLIAALEEADRQLRARLPERPRATPSTSELTGGVDIVPRSKAPLLAGVIVGVGAMLGLIIAALVHRRPEAVMRVATAAPATVVPAPAAPAVAAAAAGENSDVEIQVTTVPAGAEVLMGNERLGISPVDVKRPRANEMVTFTVRRTGYKDTARAVLLDRDQMLELTLTPRREKLAVRNTRPTAAHEGKSSPSQPKEKHTSDLRNPFE
jgi:hypothetical protein